jgi:exodeoxyribonuclease V alpha subunit
MVYVGDPDQLEPIGPGRPFAAVLAAGLWPSIDLKQIFRTAAGSSIIRAAHAVNKGTVSGVANGIWRLCSLARLHS